MNLVLVYSRKEYRSKFCGILKLMGICNRMDHRMDTLNSDEKSVYKTDANQDDYRLKISTRTIPFRELVLLVRYLKFTLHVNFEEC